MPDTTTHAVHTPTPWKLATGPRTCFHPGNELSIYHTVESDGETFTPTIAEVWPSHDGTALADAEFIVRAVNNHDALVAACEAALLALEFAAGPITRGEAQEKIEAALRAVRP
jgi:hypothetical protein